MEFVAEDYSILSQRIDVIQFYRKEVLHMPDPHIQSIAIACPYCEHRTIETAVDVPYVRGHQIGIKTFISCRQCARRRILGEIHQSLIKGWFGILAFILNPVFIVYNTLRTPFIVSNYAKARKLMDNLDIPDDNANADVAMLGYQLAICMMKADGEINEHELKVASDMGTVVLPQFDKQEFLTAVEQTKELPHHQILARQIGDKLPQQGKEAVVHYLWQIAQADNETPIEEQDLIQEIAEALDLKVVVTDS